MALIKKLDFLQTLIGYLQNGFHKYWIFSIVKVGGITQYFS